MHNWKPVKSVSWAHQCVNCHYLRINAEKAPLKYSNRYYVYGYVFSAPGNWRFTPGGRSVVAQFCHITHRKCEDA